MPKRPKEVTRMACGTKKAKKKTGAKRASRKTTKKKK
jgi:hypothetical protein